MDLIGLVFLGWWIYWLCQRSDAIAMAKKEYGIYCRQRWRVARDEPERMPGYFADHLKHHEETLDQQIAAHEKYLDEQPPPPQAPLP